MKNSKQRIISLLLVLVLSLGMLTACGGSEESDSGSGAVDSGEKVKLTVGIPQKASVTDYDDNAYTLYLEDTANVDIDFVYFSSSSTEYTQQLSLMAGSGETLPDLILGFDFSHYTVNEYGEEGFFIDLTKLIDKHAPNYKEQLNKLDEELKTYIVDKGTNTNTGAFYAMPYYCETVVDNRQQMIYINQNWLTTLGLQVPTNIQELESVLQAFKDKDPNGNGVADEIPMLGQEADVIPYIINAFVLLEGNGTFNITDGTAWDPVVTDEYRQGLIYANNLVKKGLLSELSFTLAANSEFAALISPVDGPSKVGIFTGHHELMTDAATDALDEFIALPGLADATGKGGYTVVNQADVGWRCYITEDCDEDKRAAAMRLIDTMYMDESVTRARHGEKDVDWTYEENVNAYGTQSYAKAINSQAFFQGNDTWGMNPTGFLNHWNYLLIATEGEGRIAQASRLQTEQWEIVSKAEQAAERANQLVYTTEEYVTRDDIAGLVSSYILEQTNLFASGELDPSNDSQWNEFLQTLKSQGRERLLEIAQDAYDRKGE